MIVGISSLLILNLELSLKAVYHYYRDMDRCSNWLYLDLMSLCFLINAFLFVQNLDSWFCSSRVKNFFSLLT